MTATTVEQPAGGGLAWYALSASDVTTQMGVDADMGLTVVEVERRQAEYGPNELGQVAEIESTGLVPKDPGTLPGGDPALGDRTNLAQRTRMDHRPRPVPARPAGDEILQLRRHRPVPDGEV
jgi:hypothetical protein